MKVKLLMLDKTRESFIEIGFKMYKKRISHYMAFEDQTLDSLKKN